MAQGNNDNNRNLIYLLPVLSVIDDNEGLRIKVRIPYLDEPEKPVSELPYVFPLLPKLLNINPKLNEMVLVILQSIGGAYTNRFFIGPVISQPQKMNYDACNYSAQSLLRGNQITKPLPAPSLNPDNEGTLPDRDDIALEGRVNADVVLKPEELRLRCGFKANPYGPTDDNLRFNNVDLAYIQMKYNKTKDAEEKDYSSAINIVADRINLLSHDSKTYFNLTDRKELINDEEMKKILEKAHRLPYGDVLIDFLKQFIQVFRNHTHPFAMAKPVFYTQEEKVLSTNLDDFLSNSIRIN